MDTSIEPVYTDYLDLYTRFYESQAVQKYLAGKYPILPKPSI